MFEYLPNENFSLKENDLTNIENLTPDLNLLENYVITVESKNPSLLNVSYSNNTFIFESFEAEDESIVDIVIGLTINDFLVEKTIEVSIEDVINTSPYITIPEYYQILPNTTKTLSIQLTDNEYTLRTSIRSLSPNILSASLNEELTEIEIIAGDVKTAQIVALEITIIDGENEIIKILEVTISPETKENTLPNISLEGLNENNELFIISGELNTFKMLVSDANNPELEIKIKSLIPSNNTELTDYINSQEVVGQEIILDVKEIEDLDLMFNLILNISDGIVNINKSFVLKPFIIETGTPILKFEETRRGSLPSPLGETTTFQYELIDSNSSNIELYDSSVWYGNSEEFSVTLNSDSNEITIENYSIPLEEQFGIYVRYKEKNTENTGFIYINLKSSAPQNDIASQIREELKRMKNKSEGFKEYQYIAKFYSEVLENNGIISEKEALEYVRLSLVIDSSNFELALEKIEELEYDLIYEISEDFERLENRISSINIRFNWSASSFGENTLELINEMADKSQGILQKMELISNIEEYDLTNHYFSRYKGNLNYGSYQGLDNFVFYKEYSFLNAVSTDIEEHINNN